MRLRIAALFLAGLSLANPACRPAGHPDGTGHMVQLLDSIHRHAKPEAYPYLNAGRAAMYRRQWLDPQVMDKYTPRKKYCLELIQGGKNAEAVAELEKFTAEVNPEDHIGYAHKELFDLLAIAWLRLGEQENCLQRHTSGSCIVPIRAEGVHRLTEGSRRAAALYRRILGDFPGDLQSQWLLNVAVMTLGEYPAGLPARLAIPEAAFSATDPFPRFRDVAGPLGVAVNERSGGCSVEDFDNDGFLDIMASSFGLGDQLRFFRNNGDGTFADHTARAGLTGIVSGLNLVHADYNNDGFTDVLVLRGAWLGKSGAHPNSLLQNNGDGTFEDVTRASGLLSFRASQTAAWADFNGDGWLDLFVGNEDGPDHPYPSELYAANGDGTFTDVSRRVGVAVNAFVKGCSWGDVNNDGLPDLYVSVLGGANHLFLNRGGDGPGDWRFEDVAPAAGVGEPFYSFPTWFWDYNQDGWQDLFVCGYNTRRYGQVGYDVAAEYSGQPHRAELPRLYRNNGDNTFTEVSGPAGLDKVMYGMGSNFGDLDNDGWPDCYVGTGAPDFMSVVPNRVFRNHGGRQFGEVTAAGGFGQIQKGHAVAFGDLDNDGDQDIYTVIGGFMEADVYPNMLLENPGNANAWITLHLEGTAANRSAIGARIRLVTRHPGGQLRTWYHTVSTGGSFGASSLQQEIGLADARSVEFIEVQWPGGERRVSRFTGAATGRRYKITQGHDRLVTLPLKSVTFGGRGPALTHAPHAH